MITIVTTHETYKRDKIPGFLNLHLLLKIRTILQVFISPPLRMSGTSGYHSRFETALLIGSHVLAFDSSVSEQIPGLANFRRLHGLRHSFVRGLQKVGQVSSDRYRAYLSTLD